jgi:hypothetical protein
MATITYNLGGTVITNIAGSANNFTGSLSGDVGGTQTATTITGLARTKLASGSANHIVVNDASGVLSSEAQLGPTRGGLGTDASGFTGIIKASSGSFTAGTITNTDIDASAGIVDTKLAQITTSGKVANSATTATSVNTSDAIVSRDSNGDFSANSITLSTILIGNTTDKVYTVITNNDTATTLATLATATNTAYTIKVDVTSTDSTGGNDAGSYTFIAMAKNINGTITISNRANNVMILDTGLANTDVTLEVSSTNILVNVIGVASKNIKWYGRITIVPQSF